MENYYKWILPQYLYPTKAYSSCFMHAIVACMRLPFFKMFSNFLHFRPNYQIFCPFLPFFWKIACMPLLSRIGNANYCNNISLKSKVFPWLSKITNGDQKNKQKDFHLCRPIKIWFHSTQFFGYLHNFTSAPKIKLLAKSSMTEKHFSTSVNIDFCSFLPKNLQSPFLMYFHWKFLFYKTKKNNYLSLE